MVISHNLLAMNSKRQLGITNRSKAKSAEKLSSGYRINRAADDAAGLAISEKMRRQIRGMSQGVENTQDGISLCQVADGALAEVNDMLNRMTRLSIQASNGTNSESDRAAIQREINELKIEITRVGKTTKFNDELVFDSGRDEPLPSRFSVTSLVKSPATDTGHLTEAVKVGNSYFPSASLDFSGIDYTNVKYLYDKSFSFTCSQSCAETFEFTFINGRGNDSRVVGRDNKKGKHEYYIDIHGKTNGKDIVDKLYSFVENNMPNDYKKVGTDLLVSHSNLLSKMDDNTLLVRATIGYPTEAGAINKFANSKGQYGAIDCSEFTVDMEDMPVEFGQNTTSIQTSGEANDRVDIVIDYMNSGTLGLNKLDITSDDGAADAINIIEEASAIISKQRSRLGAYQNRLEHTIANENNIIENTTAAESQIRDTDMASEMVKFSNENILAQAGQSMLVQANQSQNGVLTLLGNNE